MRRTAPPRDPYGDGLVPPTRAGNTGDGIKWFYLGAALVVSLAPLFGAPRTVGDTAAWIASALGIWWVQLTWSSIPEYDRAADHAGHIPADTVLWRFFIPIYDFYWAFAANVAMCRMINRSLERMQMPPRVQSLVAIAAMVITLVVVAMVVTQSLTVGRSPILWVMYALWFVYMVHVDAARRIMVLASRAEAAAVAAPRQA